MEDGRDLHRGVKGSWKQWKPSLINIDKTGLIPKQQNKKRP